MFQVIIIGGGLGGLLSAILLARAGVSALVIEKKKYPFHRVCGEYISNEVSPYLKSIGLFPAEFSPTRINRLQISNANGTLNEIDLPLGGFGISRFCLDHHWYRIAKDAGVKFQMETSAVSVLQKNEIFNVATRQGEIFRSKVVIGGFGKRSRLDKYLNRPFIKRRSGYVAVKYHLKHPWDPHLIAVHGFKNGYCGISMVEDQTVNLCYLSSTSNLRTYGNIESLEKHVLYKNPFLAPILSSSTKLFPKPLVINEVSFDAKSVVQDHILMVGDAAGMITPLCGNGMAIAIHSAKILAPLVLRYIEHETYSRLQMESDYQNEWRSNFAKRISAGRYLQGLFHQKWSANLMINATRIGPLAQWIIGKTHGPVLK